MRIRLDTNVATWNYCTNCGRSAIHRNRRPYRPGSANWYTAGPASRVTTEPMSVKGVAS